MTSVPKLHQRRPGNKQGTPARPHHRLIGHSCSSSRGGYISHASPTTSETLLHETEHLLALSFPFSQIAACDRPAPQEHPTDSLHWKEEGEHSAQRSTHVDFSLVSLLSFVINPPSGGHLLSNPCRVIPHPVTIYTVCIYVYMCVCMCVYIYIYIYIYIILGVARYTDVTVRYVPRFGGSRFNTISVQHEKKKKSSMLVSFHLF